MLRLVVAFCHVWASILQMWVTRTLLGRRAVTALGAGERIRREVLTWPGVTEAPHQFGGTEFRLGRRELGHVHGDYLADLPFPVRIRETLVREGRALPHHILPNSGWVSLPLKDDTAIAGAIELFRFAYERAMAKQGGV